MLHVDVMVGGGRIVDKTFRRRRRISVGRSPGNTIRVADELAPWSLPLFHKHGDDYVLHYNDHIRGRIAASPSAPWRDLSEMPAFEHGRGRDLPLEEGAHGEIDLGDATLEFEAVARLAAPRRWGAMAAFIGFMVLAAGVVGWVLSRPIAPTLPSPVLPIVRPWPRAPIILPTVTKLSPIEVRARPASRATRMEARDGVLRPGGAFPIPKLDASPSLSRGPEQLIAPSDYGDGGVLLPEALVRALGRDQGAARAVYERALRRNPAIEGDLVVRLLVNRDGSIGRVTVVKDTVPSVIVTRGVTAWLRDWHAPGQMAEAAEYELPIHFRAVKPR